MQTPLRRQRKARGLSLESVAKAVGSDTGNLSRIERRLAGASPGLAEKIVKHLGAPLDELQVLYPERYMTPDAGESLAGAGQN